MLAQVFSIPIFVDRYSIFQTFSQKRVPRIQHFSHFLFFRSPRSFFAAPGGGPGTPGDLKLIPGGVSWVRQGVQTDPPEVPGDARETKTDPAGDPGDAKGTSTAPRDVSGVPWACQGSPT